MRKRAAMAVAAAVIGTTVVGAAGAGASTSAPERAAAPVIERHLAPSSPQLKACMPNAKLEVHVKLKTDPAGFDVFIVDGRGLPKNTIFTTFLLQQAASPFGAAEYIGDFTSDAWGRTHNEFKVIVEEAFASTLVGSTRVRQELNQIGAWFADPAGDDFCLGAGAGGVTPFDGDNAAGVQAFNSAGAKPLP